MADVHLTGLPLETVAEDGLRLDTMRVTLLRRWASHHQVVPLMVVVCLADDLLLDLRDETAVRICDEYRWSASSLVPLFALPSLV